eukprot:872132-Prorocentrum_minimum.AAC.1
MEDSNLWARPWQDEGGARAGGGSLAHLQHRVHVARVAQIGEPLHAPKYAPEKVNLRPEGVKSRSASLYVVERRMCVVERFANASLYVVERRMHARARNGWTAAHAHLEAAARTWLIGREGAPLLSGMRRHWPRRRRGGGTRVPPRRHLPPGAAVRVSIGSKGGSKGKYLSSVDAREPQNQGVGRGGTGSAVRDSVSVCDALLRMPQMPL